MSGAHHKHRLRAVPLPEEPPMNEPKGFATSERWRARVDVLTTNLGRHREALEGMVYQFAYWSGGANPGLTTGGLSALEEAFEVLGWEEPHYVREMECDEPDCHEQATCGWPTRPGGTGPNGGYRHTCGDHMRELRSVSGPT